MNGYLLNFYKYSPLGKNDSYTNDYDESFVRSVVWSSFDRLEIRKINKFEQFRQSAYSEKNWVGERQFSMIYDVSCDENPKRLEYIETAPNKCIFAFQETEKSDKNFRFFGISMVDLSPEVYHYIYSCKNPGKTMRNEFLNAIDCIINDNDIGSSNICYDIYCTLGGNDLVIIWLSDQFKDIMSVIEALRKSVTKAGKNVVANISTIMGIRDINSKIDFSNVEGDLHIRLTKKEGFNFKNVKETLCQVLNKSDIKFETILGEHDLLFSISSKELASNLYKEDGFIHIRNNIFFNNFIQSNTEIAVEINYDDIKVYTFYFDIDYCREYITEEDIKVIKNYIDQIINTTIFQNAPYLQETLWILYEDYIKNISSIFSSPWINDLHYYFNYALIYLKDLTLNDENNDISNKTKYNCVDVIVSSMRHMILHVSQANRLFFEVPNTHLKHTGTYSKILRAYQGIVKQLLELAYSIPKISKQSRIVPFIIFDVIPITTSLSCPNIIVKENISNKVITIKLPYEALIDIPKYAFLLSHEIYHYIPPKDRKLRNQLLGIVVINIIVTQIMMLYLQENILPGLNNRLNDELWNKIYKEIRTYVEKIVLNNIITEFDGIERIFLKKTDEHDIEWDVYYNNINRTLLCEITNNEVLIKKIYCVLDQMDFDKIYENKTGKYDDTESDCFKEVVNKINLLLERGIQKFENWIIYYGANNRIISVADDVQYAIREALADYFMLQSTGIDKENYLKQVLYYKKILSGKNNIRQSFRLLFVCDYVLKLDIDRDNTVASMTELLKNYQISDEDKAYVISTYEEYSDVVFLYKNIFNVIFKDLDFNNIDDTFGVFADKLNRTRKLFSFEQAQNQETKFEQNVRFIENFQNQNKFGEIYIGKCLSVENRKNEVILEVQQTYNFDVKNFIKQDRIKLARSVYEILQNINSAVKELSDDENITPIWFRGHSNSDYKLLPSLYRMKNSQDTFYSASLRTTLESLFKSFRVKSFGVPEIFDEGNNSKIGTLVSMQHYSVPTNILDWSTSAFVALYFAAENQMLYSEGKQSVRETCKNNADIWILNPIRLNVAREYLKTQIKDQDKELSITRYPIPSMFGTEDEYQEFLPFVSEKHESDSFPVAIYVPFVNQRVKAQVGTFTMFSLDIDVKDIEDESTGEHYKDLAEYDLKILQDQYKNIAKEKYKPFLKRVTISMDCVQELADWLRYMGIVKSIIYPELTNISENITNEIRNFLERDTK